MSVVFFFKEKYLVKIIVYYIRYLLKFDIPNNLEILNQKIFLNSTIIFS